MGNQKSRSRIKYLWHGMLAVRDIVSLPLGRCLATLMPRNPKKILFGAWWGQQFSDNPKYFLKYLLDLNQGFKCYWIGNEEIRSQVEACPGVHFVRKGSLIVRWHILTAKWACVNLGFDCDITNSPTYGQLRLLSFWHGTAFKGALHRGYVPPTFEFKGKRLAEKIKVLRGKLWHAAHTVEAWASFSSHRMIDVMTWEAPWMFSRERSISGGTAKIDFLIRNKANETLRSSLRKKYTQVLGLPTDKRWYLYMPTWRNGLELKYSFSHSEMLDEFQAVLESQNAIIVEKQHPQVIQALNIDAWHQGSVYVVPNDAMPQIDAQELLLCADRLISDYSSCLFDFECMGRPVIHYAYDYDSFKNDDRGFEYELSEIAAGPVVKNEEALLNALKMSDDEIVRAKGEHWQLPIDGENGKGCETFAKWMGVIK